MSDQAGSGAADTYQPAGLILVDPDTGTTYQVAVPVRPVYGTVLAVQAGGVRAAFVGGSSGVALDAVAWPRSAGYVMSPGNDPARYGPGQGNPPGAPLQLAYPIPSSDVGLFAGDGTTPLLGLLVGFQLDPAHPEKGARATTFAATPDGPVPSRAGAVLRTRIDSGKPLAGAALVEDEQVPQRAADPSGYVAVLVFAATPRTDRAGGADAPSFRRLAPADLQTAADAGQLVGVVPWSAGDTTHTGGAVSTSAGLPCKALVRLSTAQSVPTGTTTILQWRATDVVAPPIGHLRGPLSGAAPWTAFTAPFAGSYLLAGLVEFTAGAGGTVRRANVTVNGVDIGTDYSQVSPTGAAFAGTRSPTVPVVAPLQLAAGDSVQVTAFHDATAALTVAAVSRMAFYSL